MRSGRATSPSSRHRSPLPPARRPAISRPTSQDRQPLPCAQRAGVRLLPCSGAERHDRAAQDLELPCPVPPASESCATGLLLICRLSRRLSRRLRWCTPFSSILCFSPSLAATPSGRDLYLPSEHRERPTCSVS